MSVHLRPYTEADEGETFELWFSVWDAIYPEANYASKRDELRRYLHDQLVPPAVVTLAVEDRRVVGMITIKPATGYIDQLAVAPERWGGGVAIALLDDARRQSPTLLELKVNQDNARAIRFYEKHAFAKVAEGFNERIGRMQFTMRWTAG